MQIKKKSNTEFIVIMAFLMSLSAFSIDALLPGLKEIAISIGILDAKNNQLLVTMIFLGLGFGQLISGPLSDSLGRKPVFYIGYTVFAIASLLCVFSTSLEMMLVGRILQGIGLSAPRTVSVAMIRDKFSGNYMARIMSFVTVIFILVPVVAPTFGKLMLDNFGWQSIFYSQLIFGFFMSVWLWKRQPETLKDEDKKEIKPSLFSNGVKEFIKHKQSIIFTLIAGFIASAFMVYLSATQQIFQEQYNLIDEFPYIFSGMALGIGLATFLNGTFVLRFGMLKLASISTIALTLISIIYIILFHGEANPSSSIVILFLGLTLFPIGFIFGNTNALTMQPIGHIAGIGAAISGFVSTIIAVPVATFIGRFIDTTALPVFVGFAVCGVLSLILILFFNISNKKASAKLKKNFKMQTVLATKETKKAI